MFSLEDRDHMPASNEEIRETLEEAIEIYNGWGPKEIKVDASGKVTAIIFKKCVSTMKSSFWFNIPILV